MIKLFLSKQCGRYCPSSKLQETTMVGKIAYFEDVSVEK